MMLKQSQSSLWLRNIQLGVWATSIALVSVAVTKDPLAPTHGYLHGFGPITWAVVASNAFGGLLVAVVMDHVPQRCLAIRCRQPAGNAPVALGPIEKAAYSEAISQMVSVKDGYG